MKASIWRAKLQRQETLLTQTMTNSHRTPRTSVNRITSTIPIEAIKIIIVLTVIIIQIIAKDSIETAQDHQAGSEDSTNETEAGALSATTHEIDLIDSVHQPSPVSVADSATGAIDTNVPIHLCAICHASDAVVHNTA